MTTGVKNRNGSNAAKVRLRRIKILRQAQFWTITSERIARTQRKCRTNLGGIGAVIFFIWLFHKEEVSSLACHSRKEFGCRISRQQQQLFGFWSRRGGEERGGEDRSIGENRAGDEGNDFFLVFHFFIFLYLFCNLRKHLCSDFLLLLFLFHCHTFFRGGTFYQQELSLYLYRICCIKRTFFFGTCGFLQNEYLNPILVRLILCLCLCCSCRVLVMYHREI